MVTETEKAWMAGFVDGEGSLTISCQIRKNRPSPAYRAIITIDNTNLEVLSIFIEHYQGAIYTTNERRADKWQGKWADRHTWHCPISSSERFLTDIGPYLRLKRRQAEILLDFLRNKQNTAPRRHINGRYAGADHLTPEELDRREQWRIAVQSLNAKGKIGRAIAKMHQEEA